MPQHGGNADDALAIQPHDPSTETPDACVGDNVTGESIGLLLIKFTQIKGTNNNHNV